VKLNDKSDEEFIEIFNNSIGYSDCLRKLGLGAKGGGSTKGLKNRINKLGLTTDHFRRPVVINNTAKFAMKDILIENSSYLNITRLKIRLVNEGVLSYICNSCNQTDTWNNKSLVLQLDHINGIHNDHRLENLRFLCPNCHSQTETYSGKNTRT
jgi:5-methylcytosine-specific restriction endonuclease McrA